MSEEHDLQKFSLKGVRSCLLDLARSLRAGLRRHQT